MGSSCYDSQLRRGVQKYAAYILNRAEFAPLLTVGRLKLQAPFLRRITALTANHGPLSEGVAVRPGTEFRNHGQVRELMICTLEKPSHILLLAQFCSSNEHLQRKPLHPLPVRVGYGKPHPTYPVKPLRSKDGVFWKALHCRVM